ncbi:FAD-dependent oxidoreductase [Pseudonocardia zijingensis]|uniref:FAD-dependent oxidoreductase n=2 Tax=Pseudonocardia zijingensis TaxID=153376 RepID=UPI003610E724
MPDARHVLVVGGGLNGLLAAMLLARDGHRVTVVERDPAEPPEPATAWEDWQRRGCAQFRLPHFMQPRFRHLLEAELPDVADALVAAGALRYDVLAALPAAVTGGIGDGDDRFATLTARRPVLEAVVARAAAAEPGVRVRRGSAVRALLTGQAVLPAVPHVAGARAGDGEELRADLVVDASGRGSPLPALLTDLGAEPPAEEQEEGGFVYYSRHFTGPLPQIRGPVQQWYDSVSILTLPADNGTWSVTFVGSARDKPLRALRDPGSWTAAMRCYPLAAHWIDAEPITGVDAFGGIGDRLRRLVVDGRPVVTGVLALGDAAAFTNPSLGRGASIGLLHAVRLRELLRAAGGADPVEVALRWAQDTAESVEPWYRATVRTSGARFAELESDRTGVPAARDESWALVKAMTAGTRNDPTVLRMLLEVAGLLALPGEVLSRPGAIERVWTAGGDAPRYPLPGPDRTALLAAAGSSGKPHSRPLRPSMWLS